MADTQQRKRKKQHRWTCIEGPAYVDMADERFRGNMHGVVADERFRGNMHGLAKDAVVLSLDRAGTQARQSMLHASLAPPPQVSQRGRRIYAYIYRLLCMYTVNSHNCQQFLWLSVGVSDPRCH